MKFKGARRKIRKTFTKLGNNISKNYGKLKRTVKRICGNGDHFPFNDLPAELRVLILSRIPAKEHSNVRSVCKDWNLLMDRHSRCMHRYEVELAFRFDPYYGNFYFAQFGENGSEKDFGIRIQPPLTRPPKCKFLPGDMIRVREVDLDRFHYEATWIGQTTVTRLDISGQNNSKHGGVAVLNERNLCKLLKILEENSSSFHLNSFNFSDIDISQVLVPSFHRLLRLINSNSLNSFTMERVEGLMANSMDSSMISRLMENNMKSLIISEPIFRQEGLSFDISPSVLEEVVFRKSECRVTLSNTNIYVNDVADLIEKWYRDPSVQLFRRFEIGCIDGARDAVFNALSRKGLPLRDNQQSCRVAHRLRSEYFLEIADWYDMICLDIGRVAPVPEVTVNIGGRVLEEKDEVVELDANELQTIIEISTTSPEVLIVYPVCASVWTTVESQIFSGSTEVTLQRPLTRKGEAKITLNIFVCPPIPTLKSPFVRDPHYSLTFSISV